MSDPQVVLALDPGKTTGWAWYKIATKEFHSGQLAFSPTCEFVELFCDTWRDEAIVVSESFIINMATVKNTQAPWSLELIGVFRHFSTSRCHRDLVLQQPASAKRFASDDRLRKVGWHRPSQGHANDAARHLLLALATRGILSNEELVALT